MLHFKVRANHVAITPTSQILSSWPTLSIRCARYLYTSGAGLKVLIESTVTRSLNTDACGERSFDFVTEFVTIAVVPLEKTTHSTLGLEEILCMAGSTSGNMDNESYACIRLS